jgi:hypothetical protein
MKHSTNVAGSHVAAGSDMESETHENAIARDALLTETQRRCDDLERQVTVCSSMSCHGV